MESDLILKCIADKEKDIATLEMNINSSNNQISSLKREISDMRHEVEKAKEREKLQTKGGCKKFIWEYDGWDYIRINAELHNGDIIRVEENRDPSSRRMIKWITGICNTYNLCIPADIYRSLQLKMYHGLLEDKDRLGNNTDDWNGRKNALHMISSNDEGLLRCMKR